MTGNLRASDILVSKIKEFEGLSLEAYKCPGGKWTIGYGHTNGVGEGKKITESQAESLLKGDLLPCEKYVDGLGVAKTQGQFDALVDFCFNLGEGKLSSSTLLAKIRGGSSDTEIQAEFRRWVYAGGKKLDGLVKRREWEAQRWTS